VLLVKPDVVARGIETEILVFVRQNGFQLLSIRYLRLNEEQAQNLYAIHSAEPFFPDLLKFMTSGQSLVALVFGESAIERISALCGHNNPAEAQPGTIRSSYGTDRLRNSVHSSATRDAVLKECLMFFDGLLVD
jgi:nucleoside-diphosphate kinase